MLEKSTTRSEPLVSLKGAGVCRDGRWLMRNVEFDVARGEIVTLIGPNGSGKSTTARTAIGAIAPDEGSVWRKSGLRVGYVPQKLAIDWTLPLTVERLMTLTASHSKAEIGAALRARRIPFHVDAVQAAGHLHIDVQKQNIDMLSLSAHKFHGPKGIGVLYARRGIPLTNIIEGGAQERGKRAGTENIPAIMGMAAALEEACAHIDANAEKITALRDKLIDGLSRIPHSVLNGDAKQRLPGNVNFCFEGIEGESLLLLLDDKGICASSGSACTSGSLDPSHVLLAIGRVHDIAHGSLRLSLSEETTNEEIEYTIKAVSEVVEYLRAMSPIWRDLISGKKEFVIK